MVKLKCYTLYTEVLSVLALRTDVMENPLLTSVSAIQPPKFANTAMVSHGNTQNSPDSVRLNFKT